MSSLMFVAGEPSGDVLAAELFSAIVALSPERRIAAFGAGGPRMAAAGIEITADMTQYSTIGFVEALARYRTFRRIFRHLLGLAAARRPDVIVCVDFSGFNRRFAHAVRRQAVRTGGWRPRIVQYVSPQVWASRPGRARSMARDLDLLLVIFPFEPQWYAAHAPGLRVEFVGHPMLDRYAPRANADQVAGDASPGQHVASPRIVLLPGSRRSEVQRHLEVMLQAAALIRRATPAASFCIVSAGERLASEIAAKVPPDSGVRVQVGALEPALAGADLAIASTGTVTMECAYFGVPAVAMYRTSWLTYQVGRRIVSVRHLAMPNLIAGETVFPELVQHEATGPAVARTALGLLADPARRAWMVTRMRGVIDALGGPGARERAARAILEMF